MLVSLKQNSNAKLLEAEFDPDEVSWKTQNFGQFSEEGVYFPEIDKSLFVKRLPGRPVSWPFLSEHMVSPCSKYLPGICGMADEKLDGHGRHFYLFLEMLEGATLDQLRGDIGIDHCYEILAGVFWALQGIIRRGYWYTDLDFRNIYIGGGESGKLIRLIDIDSCVPASLSFGEYHDDPHRRANVNEKYWSYIVSAFRGQKLDRLSGAALSQAALMYFSVDMYFNVKYQDRVFSIKPVELSRMMRAENKKFFPVEAKRLWRKVHRQILASPETGASWSDVDRFITLAYGFPKPLSMLGKSQASFFDTVANTLGAIFGGLFGGKR